MKRLSILLIVFCAFLSHGQTNVIFGQLNSTGQAPRTNITMTLQIITPKHRTVNNQVISDDALTAYTDATGYFSYTNVIFGKYNLWAGDSSSTPWTLYVGTNTLGSIPIASLITNSAAVPPNPGTNFITFAQAQALFSGGYLPPQLTNTAWGISPSEATNRLQIKYIYTNGMPWYSVLTTNQ